MSIEKTINNINLKNKTAIITGGNRGIGKAIAEKLAEFGANTIVVDLDIENFEVQTNSESYHAGFSADVSDYNKAQEIVNKLISDNKKIDILVNNAGINRDGVIWKMTEEQWDSVLNVNLKGYYNYMKAVSGIFREQKSGRIVNISSINGLRGKFGQSNYSASKAGIIGLTKAVARELGKYSVTVNAIAPGLIETEMIKSVPEEVQQKAISEIALGRMGQPDDIANLVAYLCSDLGKHITGQVINVDGGQYM